MGKMVEIETCLECPHYVSVHFCGKRKLKIGNFTQDDNNRFPGFCPLPDAAEKEGDK